MNPQHTRTFIQRSQTDPRFTNLKILSRTNNTLVVTGEIDSHASYNAFIELGRRCGFVVLCDALTLRQPYNAPQRPVAAAPPTASSPRDPLSILHLLPKPPEEDPLGGYEYHCGSCITSFFNEEGHRHIQRHGACCEDCGGELVLIWEPGDPI